MGNAVWRLGQQPKSQKYQMGLLRLWEASGRWILSSDFCCGNREGIGNAFQGEPWLVWQQSVIIVCILVECLETFGEENAREAQ